MYRQKYWFTLVELIVVITILAILGTIAIMAFSWYSKNARDSARVSDVANIKKSLELWVLESWNYPDPSDWTWVTFSWSTVWSQWTFWESVYRTVGKLDRKPIDPLYAREYTYSVLESKKEYQIGAVLEGDIAYNKMPLIESTYAAANEQKAYISGTYNGVLTSIQADKSYIIALPSIILSDLSETELKNLNGALVFEWKSNLPSSYKNTWLTMTGTDFSFTPIIVWSWSSLSNLNNQTEFENLASTLQSTYKNSEGFSSLPEYKTITTWTTVTKELLTFTKNLIETNTAQMLSNVDTIPVAVNGVCWSANNQTLWDLSSITGSGACTAWTLSSISGAGPWTWSCVWSNGWVTDSCSANKLVCNDWDAIQGNQCKDPYWSNVVLLSNYTSDDTDVKWNTLVKYSNPTVSSWTLVLDGIDDFFKAWPNTNFTFTGSEDYTLELFLEINSDFNGRKSIAAFWWVSDATWRIQFDWWSNNSGLAINIYGYGDLLFPFNNAFNNGMHHIAFVRSGNITSVYVDWISSTNSLNASYNTSWDYMVIGRNIAESAPIVWKISAIRFTKWVARYTWTNATSQNFNIVNEIFPEL